MYSDFSLLCLKKLHRGLLHSSETNTSQSGRKAHCNCTNSLLKFKSLIEGGKTAAINSDVSLGLVIAFEVTLALDQGTLPCITRGGRVGWAVPDGACREEWEGALML